MTSRTAACQCGAVTVTVAADAPAPDVNICSCQACQRRTGAPLGTIAWWPSDMLTVTGDLKRFERPAGGGRVFVSHFCPACGSNLLFDAALKPGITGVAVGAFADPGFPPPVRAVWERSRAPWLHFDVRDRFLEGSTGPRA